MDIMSDGPVLVLSGDLDVRSTMQVRTAVHELLGSYDEVVIDLSGVETVDVTALGCSRRRPCSRSATATTSRCAAPRPPYAGCCTSPT